MSEQSTAPSPCTCADRIAIAERVLRLIEVNRVSDFEAMEMIDGLARDAGAELARAANARFDAAEQEVPF